MTHLTCVTNVKSLATQILHVTNVSDVGDVFSLNTSPMALTLVTRYLYPMYESLETCSDLIHLILRIYNIQY